MKNELIKAIQELKPVAIQLGYDYPTDDNLTGEEVTFTELLEFYGELNRFIGWAEGTEEGYSNGYDEGYEDGVSPRNS